MAVYQPSELRSFLHQLGIFPRKGLSQNFLIDGNIIRKIVTAAAVQSQEIVLEIGPGPGALTQALLEVGTRVIAVEKDQILAQALERLQTPSQQLTVYCDDIITFPVEERLSPLLLEEKKAKVVANLPYHLTTPILTQLVPLHGLFSSLTIMVQEEVARRMTAQPGSSEYSSLSVFLRFYTEPHYAFTVSRNCFHPAPKVDSAVVVLKLREPPLAAEEASSFFQLTRTAFEHRRKMLRASLKKLYSPQLIEKGLVAIEQSPLARPEMLSLEQFLQLYHFLKPH